MREDVQEGGECQTIQEGIGILACVSLCGATGAHTSELFFLQAHHTVHIHVHTVQAYKHIHLLVHINGYTHTHTDTHTPTVMCTLVFPPAISTALQPN